MVRESGGDRSAVTGGTEVLSDHIAVRIASNLMEIVRIPHHLQHRQ